MTTPQQEDRVAELARQFNYLGIKADPGNLGSVVIWASASQAAMFLASLVPASAQAEYDQAVAGAGARLEDQIQLALGRHAEDMAHAANVRRLRTPPARPRGCGTHHAGECTHELLNEAP